MAISFAEQYFVERERGYKFQYLSMTISFLLPLIHGILFHWIPWRLRHFRDKTGIRNQKYFAFVKYFDSFNRVFKIKIYKWNTYIQPSLLIIIAIHLLINSIFAFVQTKDFDYLPRYYIIGKRIGRLCIGNIPPLFVILAHNNFVSAVSGLPLDKAVFFHKWLGRWMFLTSTIHTGLSLKYWLGLKFYIMVQIPPQIFGFISYSCLGMLTFGSFKFIRNFAFDFFLVQHRIFSFVMLLLAYFHNGANHVSVLLGVHLLVVDRIVSRVMGIIHKYQGPTRGASDFEILDETTIRISIPITVKREDNNIWWRSILPRYGNWRAGQHVYITVPKVSFFQIHPFTIASLQDSGKMVIVLKVLKGFTLQLKKRLEKMSKEESEKNLELTDVSEISNNCITEDEANDDSYESCSKSATKTETEFTVKSMNPTEKEIRDILTMFPGRDIFTLKAHIIGPTGGNYQPLTKFDSVLFFSVGTGASFTLPVALDLLKENRQRDMVGDFLYRPELTKITVIMTFQRQKNLEWYDHLWEEFIPFITSGKVNFIIHITREIPDAAEVESVIECPNVEDEDKSSFTSGNDSMNLSRNSTLDQTGLSLVHGRPVVDEYIKKAIKEQNNKSYRKAFACISCGPHVFNGDIKTACEKYKWEGGAPLVYCHTESFG